MDVTEADSADVLNILIASDIHLGYEERDPIRGTDSFQTFEEILSIAVEREVDFILLGGDLFHDAKPTQHCIQQALGLFRRYCMGDRPVSVEFLSDQAENFKHCTNPVVNYEDPNLNIAIPVFSIHGNHDDPTGPGRTSTLDLLSESGLINYFGKWLDLKQVEISPLLMRKGATKLALYGLSYIKDERLSRLFKQRKVQLYQPKEETNEWFNIFVLHQNRADRGPNNCLPEDALPNFLDVVMWGHEHECRIIPEVNTIQGFSVIQPGSPVATSLCEGETKPKHVGILTIYKKKFELKPIKLKTVRPFVMDTVILSETTINYISDKVSEAVQDYLQECVSHLIEKAKCQISGHRKQPELPLIRLRVEYNDDVQTFNPLQFGLRFSTDVANPRDIILLKKERKKRTTSEGVDLDKETLNDILDKANELDKVESVVERYFSEVASEKSLKVLSVKGLNQAVNHFIEKSDVEAISDLIKHQITKTATFLKGNVNDANDIEEALENYRSSRTANNLDEVKEVQTLLSSGNRTRNSDGIEVMESGDDDDFIRSTPATSRGRGRGRGRGARGRGKQADVSTTSTRGSRATTKGQKQPLDVTQTTISSTFANRSRSHRTIEFSDSD